MATATPLQMQDAVSQFLATPRKLLIDGRWVAASSGKTFDSIDPATGEVLARVAEGDKADIDAAVKAARRLYRGIDICLVAFSHSGEDFTCCGIDGIKCLTRRSSDPSAVD